MRALTLIHNGVLIPTEMQRATDAELDTYTATVKAGNRAFIAAVYAVELEAERLGVELPS